MTDSAIIDTDGDGYGDVQLTDTDGDGYYDAEEAITTENTAMEMPTTEQLGYAGGYEQSYEDSGDAAGLEDAATDFAQTARRGPVPRRNGAFACSATATYASRADAHEGLCLSTPPASLPASFAPSRTASPAAGAGYVAGAAGSAARRYGA
ncbi:hypothetical protein SAMN05444817_11055 [Corynebacterium appendicis CIP 107643]|uniref:Uncharacterized protein n=1 Tax=Corynebacterium appendicis CIP 107643 TaxID=1161099 RepID=A0A1N7JR80_9CORY|nr:hypothetical protein CAPP_08855 [Corynebacterium appendicis CIP 107643]SIS51840.1 hypothetical protein SAMN05444817_11055 [Corynebacterium appendicis CIP 107643]